VHHHAKSGEDPLNGECTERDKTAKIYF